MEFNQENRSFCTPSAVLDTVAEQLADVDLTLPDYCPDIEKILKCTLNECVGGTRHSRKHDDILAALHNQLSHILNSLGGANRSSSKFQDLHYL